MEHVNINNIQFTYASKMQSYQACNVVNKQTKSITKLEFSP